MDTATRASSLARLPVVKSLTNDILVPADAEMTLEGYLDERGYAEPEGPFGEYMGYDGAIHMDPVFHYLISGTSRSRPKGLVQSKPALAPARPVTRALSLVHGTSTSANALDALGRTEEAKVLRERYGLAALENPKSP